jgi:hypothetical protein
MPVPCPMMGAFGGERLETLYVASASKPLTPAERTAQPTPAGSSPWKLACAACRNRSSRAERPIPQRRAAGA